MKLTMYEENTSPEKKTQFFQKIVPKILINLILVANLTYYSMGMGFTDCNNHWGSGFIEDAASGGYVTGYEDGTYKPDEEVTGNEFAVMISTAFLGGELFAFSNNTSKKWADPYVNSVLALGEESEFFSELVESVDFEEPYTRLSAAHLVAAILEEQQVNDHDERDILEAVASVKDGKNAEGAEQLGLVIHYQMMKGMPDGLFHGSDTLTRAEAAVILSNMTNSPFLQVDPFGNYQEEIEPVVVVETVVVETTSTTVLLSLTITLFVAIAYSIWLRITYIKEIDSLKENLQLVQDRYFQQKKKMEILSEELASSEKRNRELQEQIDQIRSLLSHELQMPTAVIRGYGELLLDDMDETRIETGVKKDYLMKIINRANYISKALHAQLALMTRQTHEVSCVPLDLMNVAKQVVEDTEYTASARGITLQVLPWDGQVLVLADGDLLNNILYNLIENSIKYMGREGMITLRFETKGDCVHLCVKDDGLGLDTAETCHIFELNYQGSNRVQGKGFGHGLHMVQQTVLKMNGRIWADSRPGQGMAITFALPLAETPLSISIAEKETLQV